MKWKFVVTFLLLSLGVVWSQSFQAANSQPPVAAAVFDGNVNTELNGSSSRNTVSDSLSWFEANMRETPAFIGAGGVELPGASSDKGSLPDQEDLIQPAAPLIRKDFNNTTRFERASLEKAFLAMMKLDCKAGQKPPACEQVPGGAGVKADNMLDKIGWKYQASIHGSLPGATNQTAWDTCEHSSWLFLSWHRMELYFFEKIIRAFSGNSTLTLPYWNFTVPDKDLAAMCVADKLPPNCVGARLPAAFRAKPFDKNPFYWPYRDDKLNTPPPNAGNDKALPLCSSVVATKNAFAQTAFFTNNRYKGLMSFGGGAIGCPKEPEECLHLPFRPGTGQIELVPHDMVHGAVGDRKGSMSMASADGAGLDPIFWPVHVNIDRAWSCWQSKHPGTEPKSDLWLSRKFTFFDVEMVKGEPVAKEVTLTGKQVIDTANKLLNYRYDDACQGFEVPRSEDAEQLPEILAAAIAAESSPTPLSATVETPFILTSEPVTVSINLPSELQARIQGLVLVGAPAGSILLTVDGLAVDRPSGAAYEIYLNLPQGITPKYQSLYYVDELPFFGIGHEHHHTGTNTDGDHTASQLVSLSYDITGVVRQLVANGEWRGNQVSVTFSANTMDPAAPPCVSTGGASLEQRARFASLTLTAN